MKKNLAGIAFAGALLAFSGTAAAFPITFVQAACSGDAGYLEESVRSFEGKLIKVKRFETRGSQHRKHVERHAGEIIEAFDAASTSGKCSGERLDRLEQLRNEIKDLI
jgi:hypothetical protein